MAAWQFDVQLVRTSRLTLSNEREVREAGRLTRGDYEAAKGYLEELGLPVETLADGWSIYGDPKGNRVDLALSDDVGAEISARIDAVADSDLFCNFICILGIDLGCELWASEPNRVFEPSKDALVGALMASAAWQYALEPSRLTGSRS